MNAAPLHRSVPAPALLELPQLDAASLLPPDGRRLLVCAAAVEEIVLGVGGLLAALAPDVGIEIRVLTVPSPSAREALDRLGLARTPVVLPPPAGGGLLAALADLVVPGDTVLAPWEGDGGAGTLAIGRAAATVAGAVAARLVEVPAWTWADPDSAGAPVPWDRAVRLPLEPRPAALKRQAVGALRAASTLPALTDPALLHRLTGEAEVVFV